MWYEIKKKVWELLCVWGGCVCVCVCVFPSMEETNIGVKIFLIYDVTARKPSFYVHDEHHEMILLSPIKTFIFMRGVIIQLMPIKKDVIIF